MIGAICVPLCTGMSGLPPAPVDPLSLKYTRRHLQGEQLLPRLGAALSSTLTVDGVELSAERCIQPSHGESDRLRYTAADEEDDDDTHPLRYPCASNGAGDEWLSVQVAPRSSIKRVQILQLKLDVDPRLEGSGSPVKLAHGQFDVHVIREPGNRDQPLGVSCGPATLPGAISRPRRGEYVDLEAECGGLEGQYVLLRLPGKSRRVEAFEMYP